MSFAKGSLDGGFEAVELVVRDERESRAGEAAVMDTDRSLTRQHLLAERDRERHIQIEPQMVLPQNGIQQDFIPENDVCIRICIEILQLQRTSDAHFLSVQISRLGRTARPDANLAAGISTKHCSVRDQHSIYAKPCRADSGCHACESTANNCELRFDCFRHDFVFHTILARKKGRQWRPFLSIQGNALSCGGFEHSKQNGRGLAALDGTCRVERALRVGTRQDTRAVEFVNFRRILVGHLRVGVALERSAWNNVFFP